MNIIEYRHFVYEVTAVARNTARINAVYLLDRELGVYQRF
jgi:hypothetical protein